MGTGETPAIKPVQEVDTAEVPLCEWAATNGTCLLDEIHANVGDLHKGFQRLAKIVKDLHGAVAGIAASQARIETLLTRNP